MNGVTARQNENVEKLLRRFKRVADNANVVTEMKKFRSYEKPSEEKRRLKKAAIRKAQKDQRDEESKPKRRR